MYEVAIIGAGPAGISAGIQLKKLDIEAVIIEKSQVGGLIKNAFLVENIAGINKVFKGVELAEALNNDAEKWNLNILNNELVKVSKDKQFFKLYVSNQKQTIFAKFLILAVGTNPVYNQLSEYINLYYDICSLPMQVTQTIKTAAIIGGGESAFDYSLSLTKLNANVDLYIRSSKSKVRGNLKKLVEQNNKINIKYSTVLKKEQAIQYDVLISAIGRESSIKQIEFDFDLTSDNAVFIAGDARLASLGQYAIAIGDGLYAATIAARYFKY